MCWVSKLREHKIHSGVIEAVVTRMYFHFGDMKLWEHKQNVNSGDHLNSGNINEICNLGYPNSGNIIFYVENPNGCNTME